MADSQNRSACVATTDATATSRPCTFAFERSAALGRTGRVNRPGIPGARRLGGLYAGRRGRSGVCGGTAFAAPT